MAEAIFALGCFWGPQKRFQAVQGVIDTEVGYCGGHLPSPDYRTVCSGDTGHAEAVRIEFDQDVISYDDMLAYFWDGHDPTTPNRQGPDVGTQYRSAIFTLDEEQMAQAQASRNLAQQHFPAPIVTEILPLDRFWPAEDYHQHYLTKRGY